MLTYCSSIIKGLPDWARKLEKAESGKAVNDEDDNKEAEISDEYSKEIGDLFEKENEKGLTVEVKN